MATNSSLNAIEALQLALSKPGTKVRPKGETGRYYQVDLEENPHTLEGRQMHEDEFGNGYLPRYLAFKDIINSDGTPVLWEEVNE